MTFTIKARTTGNVVVLDVTGRLIMGAAAEGLRAAVHRLLQDGQRWFILNLAGVSFMDTCGLSETLNVYSAVRNRGGNVVLLNASRRTSQLLQITKLATVFDMYDDEARAIDALTIQARFVAGPGVERSSATRTA